MSTAGLRAQHKCFGWGQDAAARPPCLLRADAPAPLPPAPLSRPPTHTRARALQLRSSGFGLLNAVGRVSSFATTYAAGALLDVKLWAPLVMAAVMLAAGSAAMLLLPEPAGGGRGGACSGVGTAAARAVGVRAQARMSWRAGGDGVGWVVVMTVWW